jgi:hypothetical protein
VFSPGLSPRVFPVFLGTLYPTHQDFASERRAEPSPGHTPCRAKFSPGISPVLVFPATTSPARRHFAPPRSTRDSLPAASSFRSSFARSSSLRDSLPDEPRFRPAELFLELSRRRAEFTHGLSPGQALIGTSSPDTLLSERRVSPGLSHGRVFPVFLATFFPACRVYSWALSRPNLVITNVVEPLQPDL